MQQSDSVLLDLVAAAVKAHCVTAQSVAYMLRVPVASVEAALVLLVLQGKLRRLANAGLPYYTAL